MINVENHRQHLVHAGVSGLIAGVVFGIIIGFAGMLPMVAKLVGSTSPTVGFIVNLVVSVIVALIFVVLFGKNLTSYGRGAVWGLGYGFVWWILGPLVLMPLMLGMDVQLTAEGITMGLPVKLGSHLVFGLLLGLLYVKFTGSGHDQPHETHEQEQQKV